MGLTNRQLFLQHVAQTSPSSLAFEVERAEGIYFHTPEGKTYIDLVSGVSVSATGHGHPRVVEAVREQASRYMHTMVYGEFVQSPQVEYATWLAEHLPGKLDNVFFVNSGSEAIEGAMKLAKRYTGRPRFLAFKKAYHGGTQGALSILGDPSYQSGYLPLLPGISHLEYNNEEELGQITRDVAAVIMEPIQAEAGIIEPENDFLKKVRDACNRAGCLLILDEIQTGMGRTGKLLASEHYGVEPDILCLAKSFGGGMPLGAFISSRELMETLTHTPSLGHITTFGGHPVSCAAGLASMKVVDEEGYMEHALEMGERYRNRLRHEKIRGFRGRGLFLGTVLADGADVGKFIDRAFENGLIMDRFLFSSDAFRIAPPLIISEEEVDRTIELISLSLDQC